MEGQEEKKTGESNSLTPVESLKGVGTREKRHVQSEISRGKSKGGKRGVSTPSPSRKKKKGTGSGGKRGRKSKVLWLPHRQRKKAMKREKKVRKPGRKRLELGERPVNVGRNISLGSSNSSFARVDHKEEKKIQKGLG